MSERNQGLTADVLFVGATRPPMRWGVTYSALLFNLVFTILDAATSESDFDLRDLRKKPISIYVGVHPDDMPRLRPVLSLLCQQAIGLQTRELPEHNPELHYQVMMMLDEFTALGRIPIIAEAISYLPGYNVRVVLVIQTPAQLREVYGVHNAETMLKSLAARIVFAPKDFSDAREISEELGYTTVKVRTWSKPIVSFDSRAHRARSVNVSEQRRALLLPQEVKEIGTEQAVVSYEGLRPIRCRKIRYFSDRRFKARLLPPPEVPAPNWRADREDISAEPPPSASSARSVPASSTATTAEGTAPMGEAYVIRDATAADVERIDELGLEDYHVDFSELAVPDHEGPATTEELEAMKVSFLGTIGMGERHGDRG